MATCFRFTEFFLLRGRAEHSRRERERDSARRMLLHQLRREPGAEVTSAVPSAPATLASKVREWEIERFPRRANRFALRAKQALGDRTAISAS
jgi:hypothetical protein